MPQRETERIQDQFARAFEGAAWHGRPVLDLLSHISAAGIGGVIAFTVSQRTKELGIRLALRSSRKAVVALLLRQGFAVTAGGLVLGVVGALALGGYVESLLYGVETTDLATFVAGMSAFAAVAFVAVLVLARRVAKIDPREMLTSE